jgi:divalent metal cation (Fe/Co/Zn/Cd) transporter
MALPLDRRPDRGANRRASRLEWATIGWNAAEAAVALAAGAAASSVALVGFGLDSVIEVSAAFVVLWQFRGVAAEREHRALKAIGASFFLLAAYVAFTSVRDLVTHAEPDAAPVGIVLTSLSMLVMPALARVKHRTAHAIGSKALLADSNQTKLCAYLSAATLAGLAANAVLGWWWADPLAALFIAFVAVREGGDAWRGQDDCC